MLERRNFSNRKWRACAVEWACLMTCLLLGSFAAHAQEAARGGIRGVVYDADYNIPVPAVRVSVTELGRILETGNDGHYAFADVVPGVYTVVFVKEGYQREIRINVLVSVGAYAEVDTRLFAEYTEMEELIVSDIDLGVGSETALISLKMASVASIDSIGAEFIGRAGAGDAASVLRMVSGASVQDGKYAVVRGLPDRYVNSQLNGVRLPTSDADRRSVQLDQFPSAMIESIQVTKTFMPDQQGDASGGAVNIKLKGVPDNLVASAQIGTSYNTQSSWRNDFLTYKGGGLNYWGIDDGGRKLPFRVSELAAPQVVDLSTLQSWLQYGIVSQERYYQILDEMARLDTQTKKLTPVAGTSRGHSTMGSSWSATVGDRFDLSEDSRIGMLGTFSYKHDYAYYDHGLQALYQASSAQELTQPPTGATRYDVTKGTESVLWAGAGVLGLVCPAGDFTLSYVHSQAADDHAWLLEDNTPDQDNKIQRVQTLNYIERTTDTLQLRAAHTWKFLPEQMSVIEGWLAVGQPVTDWSLSRSSARQYEPDKRSFAEYYTYENLYWTRSENGPLQRFWRDILEKSRQYSINQKIPFTQWSEDEGYLKFGLFRDFVTRSFRQDGFFYTGGNSTIPGSPDDRWSDTFFDPANIGYTTYFLDHGWLLQDPESNLDYDGRQNISALYWMFDLPLCHYLSASGGVRYEQTAMSTEIRPSNGSDTIRVLQIGADGVLQFIRYPVSEANTTFGANIDEMNVLPAFGLTVSPIPKTLNLRLNYAETIARPTFKELAPVEYYEYLGGDTFVGNSALQISHLRNYDIRIEYMPSQGSLWSASLFRKNVTSPIEYDAYPLWDGRAVIRPNNYPKGWVKGAEFEVRQNLGTFWSALQGLTLGCNLTVLQSRVERPDNALLTVDGAYFSRSRDMLGQPAYIANAHLTYDIEATDTSLGMFWTRKGDTLVAGDGNVLGAYKPCTYDLPYDTVDLSVQQKFAKRWKLTLRAKNILNPKIQQEYRSDLVQGVALKGSYTKGIEYGASLSCSW